MWRYFLSLLLVAGVGVGCVNSGGPATDQASDAGASEDRSNDEAASPPVETASSGDGAPDFSLNLDERGRALRGYDPVAYFTNGEPTAGADEHSLRWNNADWHFATAENRDLFAQNPEHYAPSNGGYCTFGIVLKKKLDADPEVWWVNDDRLYLFLNQEVQAKFLNDADGNVEVVAEHWPEIRDISAEELEAGASS